MSSTNTKIYPIEHDWVYNLFRTELLSSRVAISKQDKNTKYLTWLNGIHPVAVVGYMNMKSGHIRLKTDYVRPQFRGQGIYSELFKSRLILIFMTLKPKVLTAYCTPMSLPKYLKEGFVAMSERNGITYVKKQIENANAELQRLESRIPSSLVKVNE